MIPKLRNWLGGAFNAPALTPQSLEQLRRDRAGLTGADPGADAVVRAGINWLGVAQDRSLSQDGGVARDFSLQKGWSSSYPETTGYIVPTVLDYARHSNNEGQRERARRMLDWLVSIQFPDGGFQGGRIDSTPKVPVTFNTGQILIGLAAGVREFGDAYLDPMNRAAAWLRDSQDADGCWRRHPTPFAEPGEKAYETHVSWGLFEAARLTTDAGYGEAGLKQVAWALTKQQSNGWFADCCLSNPNAPLTHTIGYVLRGMTEAYRFSGDPVHLQSAVRTADSLLELIDESGRIAGRLDANWKPAVSWVCLTGTVQIAACWILLYQATRKPEYLDAAKRANSFVRRTIHMEGDPDVVGGVRGSFPVDGDYGTFEYLNWATKFCIDSNMLEVAAARAQS